MNPLGWIGLHPSTGNDVKPPRVLVVSEDPVFINRVRAAAEPEGVPVVACLGPAAGPCFLDQKAVCRIAGNSSIVLVDPPPGGSFRDHLIDIAAGDYAERLQRAHPHSYVVLLAGEPGGVGSTGDVAAVSDRDAALGLVRQLLHVRSIGGSKKGAPRMGGST